MLKEITHFIIHLRLHYQLLILSGGFLLGGFIAGEMDFWQYLLQFFNVHVLLFGGATAYNSYWDKDTGPIGGLKNPPVMSRWMHPVSLGLMFAGLLLAFPVGTLYAFIFLLSLVLFWLYSTPHARWKGGPILSLIAIGVSTGLNSVLLGILAAGGAISATGLLSAAGATFILLSLYPVSQIFQMEEDRKRQDMTFAIRYGGGGFFKLSFLFGSVILTVSLVWISITAATLLFVGTVISGTLIARLLYGVSGDPKDYSIVMKSKFLASLSFVTFFLIGNIIQYS